jgi:Leucine-rich repeat (LRR) protein
VKRRIKIDSFLQGVNKTTRLYTKMTTEIEAYLNSLSEDISIIDISSKNIDYIPDLSRFKNLEVLYCYKNKLKLLPNLPQNLTTLICHHNNLTSLSTLPQNLKILYCSKNQLTSLPTLPQNLKILNCCNNKLTCLSSLPQNLKILNCSENQLSLLPILPQDIIYLNCSENQLSLLHNLPQNLVELYCYNNKLTSLPALPQNLEILNCSENQLTLLPTLPQNLENLICDNNPIYKIVNNNNLIQIKKYIKILNNFRYLYYCLKFKKQLRNYWLWEKVREPIIMKKYHPKYLIENLGEDDDLDIVLNNWINK